MSWNAIICTNDGSPLGSADDIKSIFDAAFPNLKWDGYAECVLPEDNGFRLEIGAGENPIMSIWSHGGFNHLKEFAGICKEHGWVLGDAQEGADFDLDDPYSAYPPKDRP